jgi:UDP-N-acetylglucosamine 4-epimerase
VSKILVTGGLGFIGLHLAEKLSSMGHRVLILDYARNGANVNIDLIRGDIRNHDLCMEACKGADVIFHTAGIASIRRALDCPEEAYDVNVEGTRSLLNAAIKRSVPLFVYSSSGKIYGNSVSESSSEEDAPVLSSPYAETKYAAETVLRRASMKGFIKGISLRYFSVYGPRQKLDYGILAELLAGLYNSSHPVINANEDTRRDFTYIADVIAANMKCLETDVESYEAINIASGETVGLHEAVDILSKVAGKNIQPVFKGTKTGMCDHTGADITKAERILGYKSRTTLEEGLRKTIQWLKKEKSLRWK